MSGRRDGVRETARVEYDPTQFSGTADQAPWRGGSSGAWRSAWVNYAVIAVGVSITSCGVLWGVVVAAPIWVGVGGVSRAMEASER